MLAIGIETWGGPDALHVVDLPEPHPGPGQVRVRVAAAGVAPVDAMARSGLLAPLYKGQQPPFVPGMEVAGILDEVGPDTTNDLPLGSPVVAFVSFAGANGGYSDWVIVPAASVIRAPEGLTMAEAATTVLNPLTARNALDTLQLAPGATLLVTGAAGAVGGYVTTLAAREGLQVVAQVGAGDVERARSAGATWLVSRNDNLAEAVHELLPEGVDAVVDTAGLGEVAAAAVKDGGQVAALRPFAGVAGRGITVHGLNVRQRATDQAALSALRDLVEQGLLPVHLGETFPAREASRAHQSLESGAAKGRIVLEFPVG